jgi:hypothetical protein
MKLAILFALGFLFGALYALALTPRPQEPFGDEHEPPATYHELNNVPQSTPFRSSV